MKEERVQQIIERVSAGNSGMRVVLGLVHAVGREQIAKYPDSRYGDGMVARRMVLAASKLVKGRINYDQLVTLDCRYWETDEGKQNSVKVEQYVEELKRRSREMKAGSGCGVVR